VYVPDRRSWDEIGMSYKDGYYERGVYYSQITDAIKRRSYKVVRFIESVTDLSGKRLLDVGCGEGELMQFARERGADVTGIEPSPAAAEKARQKGLSVFVGNFDDYVSQNPSPRFDFVTFDFVLELMERPSKVLQKCWEMVADDGHVLVETGDRLNYTTFPFPLRRIIRNIPIEMPAYRWSRSTLEAMLNVNGFKVIANDWRWRDPQDLGYLAKKCVPYPLESVSFDSYYRVVKYFANWHFHSYMLGARDSSMEMARKTYGRLRRLTGARR
jgi:2-polyprenyl-3-methyl-5-hydroxy-6-metoxy-1,4-benzoquinol methylase